MQDHDVKRVNQVFVMLQPVAGDDAGSTTTDAAVIGFEKLTCVEHVQTFVGWQHRLFVWGSHVGPDQAVVLLQRIPRLANFVFESAWAYPGNGDRQSLNLRISKTSHGITEQWQDQHPMVAVSFAELRALLEPEFEVILLEHDYQKIVPWDLSSGNALFVCIKTADAGADTTSC